MLGKLMKYDLRSCLRKFGPLWIAIAALAVINGFSMRGLFEQLGRRSGFLSFFFGVLPPMALFGLYVAMAVLTLIFICERFYKGLLGDEGYLMFTLPASVDAHIASKTLSALILEIASWLVALVSGMLLLLINDPGSLLEGFREFLRSLGAAEIPAAMPWLLLELLVLMLVVAAAETLKIYTAIALGHLARRRRAFWAILAYLGINFVLNLLMGIFVDRGIAWNLFGRVFSQSWGVMFDGEGWVFSGLGIAAGAMGGAILAELILCALLFLATRMILTKKLNLE